jgi:hypothetical protein
MRLAEIKQQINEGRDGWFYRVVQPSLLQIPNRRDVALEIGAEIHVVSEGIFYVYSNSRDAFPLPVPYDRIKDLENEGILAELRTPHFAQVYNK